jgi:hypothetical protein
MEHELATQTRTLKATLQKDTFSSKRAIPTPPHEVRRSPGQPLDASTRAFMEPRFGHDFSRVRVHPDSRAVDKPTPPPAPLPSMRHVKVWFNAFIPHKKIRPPIPFSPCFSGDKRSFSNDIRAPYRTHQEIEFDPLNLSKILDWKDTGTTHKVKCDNPGRILVTGKAPVSELTNGGVVRSGDKILVDFQESAKNPLFTLAPAAIDADVTFSIDPLARRCQLTGKHDGFPAYEGYVAADGGAGVEVYRYDPIAAGKTLLALFPPMDKTISGSAIRF